MTRRWHRRAWKVDQDDEMLQRPHLAFVHCAAELDVSGVEDRVVVDAERDPVILGALDERQALAARAAHRLLDENSHATVDQMGCDLTVSVGRDKHVGEVAQTTLNYLGHAREDVIDFVGGAEGARSSGIDIAHTDEAHIRKCVEDRSVERSDRSRADQACATRRARRHCFRTGAPNHEGTVNGRQAWAAAGSGETIQRSCQSWKRSSSQSS